MSANEDEMKKIAFELTKDVNELYAKTEPIILNLYDEENEIVTILTIGGILNAMLSKHGSQTFADMIADKVKILQNVSEENE